MTLLYQKRDDTRSKAIALSIAVNKQRTQLNWNEISNFLCEYYPEDYEELQTSELASPDGFQLVDGKGNVINQYYKWNKWSTGQNISYGLLNQLEISNDPSSIWKLKYPERQAKMREWEYELNRENREELAELLVDLRTIEADLKALHKVSF